MKTRTITFLLALLFATVAFAQAPPITSWTAKVYAAGTNTVVQTFIITVQQATCNQPKFTSTDTLNPDTWVWDDPFTAGRDCFFDDNARVDPGRLSALPDGNYEGTTTAVNSDGASPESTRAPFTRRRPVPPAVPTGVRLIHRGQ